MKLLISSLFVLLLTRQIATAAEYSLVSPNGLITINIIHDETAGTLTYKVASQGTTLIENSPLGINTDKGDFTSGLLFDSQSTATINETYTLPQGKVSTYVNNAKELNLAFHKGSQNLNIIFRAYDQGIAFRYAMPGNGSISISAEESGFKLVGAPVFWGQPHPNNWGNESTMGKITGPDFSLALLCELSAQGYWILLGQAATYANYCIPYLQNQSGTLKIKFPIQQTTPIITTLPFSSPWRVAVISKSTLSTVVEQTLFENLNPPTDTSLVGATWIKAGRSTFDWFAGDKSNLKGWTDAVSAMTWEYHLVDDGWEGYIGNINQVVNYAASKGVGIMAWKATPTVTKPVEMHAFLKQWQTNGFKGAKIDFFDRLPKGSTAEDYEDTQMGLTIRDSMITIASKYKQQVVFHGCSIPSGERRRWPHLLGVEAVVGQEGNPSAFHDNCIAYIRNPVGPVDYSPAWFGNNGRTDGYQVATSVVYESGFLIFADLFSDYLAHPSRPFLSQVPSNWDEVKFLSGYPGSHTLIARRKGSDWFAGGITNAAATRVVKLDFLQSGLKYRAEIYRDNTSGSSLLIEARDVYQADSLSIPMLAKGGFAIRFHPTTITAIGGASMSRHGKEIKMLGLTCVFPAEWSGTRKSVAIFDLAGKHLYSGTTEADSFDPTQVAGLGAGLKLFRIKTIP